MVDFNDKKKLHKQKNNQKRVHIYLEIDCDSLIDDLRFDSLRLRSRFSLMNCANSLAYSVLWSLFFSARFFFKPNVRRLRCNRIGVIRR